MAETGTKNRILFLRQYSLPSRFKHNLISVEEDVEEIEDEIGNSYEYSSLNIKWNGRKPENGDE